MKNRQTAMMLRIVAAAVGLLPLLLLALWAYEPARPFEYPTVRELLSTPYQEPALHLDRGAYLIRFTLVFSVSILFALMVALRASTVRFALLGGVLASLFVTSPLLVDAVLGKEKFALATMSLSSTLVLAFLLLLAVRKRPATQLALVFLLMLLGTHLTLRTAAAVAIRSEPVLYVLDAAARQPEDPQAQLALGLHLLSIDGPCQAVPLLRSAGAQLADRFADSGEKALFNAANSLVELSVTGDTGPETCTTKLQESDHKSARDNSITG